MQAPSSFDAARDAARRFGFSLCTVGAAVALLAWGGFVTSINAGLAVPDWPTSFNSLDPFNPWPNWWKATPILAEHGHRLLGALIGLLTLTLAFWTQLRDGRPWMRRLGWLALALVLGQGVLGGLRVVWVSVDLAVVHAAVAQLFFALLAAMALFMSPAWRSAAAAPPPAAVRGRFQKLACLAAVGVYFQIILGAMLRHPGAGINPLLAALHMGGAFAATMLAVALVVFVRWFIPAEHGWLRRGAAALGGILGAQLLLGLVAYFVLLDESGMIQPSNVQVLVNTAHLVVGALLFAATAALAAAAFRWEPVFADHAAPALRMSPAR